MRAYISKSHENGTLCCKRDRLEVKITSDYDGDDEECSDVQKHVVCTLHSFSFPLTSLLKFLKNDVMTHEEIL